GKQRNVDRLAPVLFGNGAVIRGHRRRRTGADEYVRFGAGGQNQLAALRRTVIDANRMDGASRLVCDLPAGGGESLLPPRRNEAFYPFARQRQDRAPPHACTTAIDDRLAAPDPQIHAQYSLATESRSCSRLGNID